jgi:two-component system, NarL family, nitrate/nitrite response regulator NarL
MTLTRRIRLTVADDHSLFINGMQLLMQEEDWVEIIDIARDGRELLDILPGNPPDIVLLDINMPGINGLKAVQHIRSAFPAVKVIMLSTYNEDHLVEKAKLLGAKGYLLKNCQKEDLFRAIRMVASGLECWPFRAEKEANEFDEKDGFLRQFHITKRELQILALIKAAHTNQQIADRLFLSVYTVETHRKNIMQKLGLNSPAALIRFLLEHDL